MHNVSVKMSDKDFSVLDGMAKQSRASRSEILCEALRIKKAFDARELKAVREGLESAKNEPLTSHEDAVSEFAEFRKRVKLRAC